MGFPINAVSIMRRICEEAEAVIDYESLYLGLRMGTLKKFHTMHAVESVCSSAVKATICASETTIRQLNCVRGVTPMLTASFVGTDSVIAKALDKAKQYGMVKAGDCVVAVHGQREECQGQSNLMKMVIVP